MQPKAAKKIGGMTPKKMTGGQIDPVTFTFDKTEYTVSKPETQDGKLTICVSTAMPGAEAKPAEAKPAEGQSAEGQPGEEQPGEEKPGANLNDLDGGKKKRKSSKKRKSMKKKGGMKRKSMKVKA